MVSKRYLLDTSAIRGISRDWIVNRQRKENDLLVSPFTLYELICHIDGEKAFNKFKTQMLKCLHVHILAEPLTAVEIAAGRQSEEIDYHIQMGHVLKNLLLALASSESLEEFYRSTVIDHLGKYRQVDQIAERGRRTLENASSEYQEYISEITKAIRDGSVSIDSDASYQANILALVREYLKSMGIDTDVPNPSINSVGNQIYINCAYIFERSAYYSRVSNYKIDPNDYEDSEILLHLALDDSIVLVTNDKGIQHAVNSALNRLERLNVDIKMMPKCISVNDLKTV